MRIEPYDSKYFENCIEIIQSNTLKYIDQSEHSDYRDYLLRDDKTYFVLFNDFNLVACGGYGLNKSQTKAGLSWGLVNSKYHNQGYGSELLNYRIEHIKNNFSGVDIYLDTSQKTYKFFEKFGFVVKKITTNGYGVGLDRYDMILKVKPKK